MEPRSSTTERVRAAELAATLCLATDLGMGFPFEHGLRTALVAARLADALGADREARGQAYYAALLSHAGCTADAHVTAEIFGGFLVEHFHPVMSGTSRQAAAGLLRALPDPGRPAPVRALQAARRLPRLAREQRPHLRAMCEVARMLSDGLGLPGATGGLLDHLLERWDGQGPLRRARGDAIPLPMRIVHVAVDASFQAMLAGPAHAARTIGERAGGAFDPRIAACLAGDAGEILAPGDGPAWDAALAAEPGPSLMVEGDGVDRAIAAMGAFADLVSPDLAGHSRGVADLAAASAGRAGLDAGDRRALWRAGLVHDLGRAAVHPRVWRVPGPLAADQLEEVRLHPYHTERVLSRSPFLAPLAATAGAHHERLDGSGYHRGVPGAALALPARLLAAADAYHAMTEPRRHRPARTAAGAVEELAREVTAGRLDAEAATAVIEAAGRRAPRLERPAGLTGREAQVVAMLARGLMTKQVAAALGISAKTADTHVQHAYRKLGVSTRAGATLFAIENGLVGWGDAGASGHR